MIILIIVAVGGLIFWKRYGSSNEKANLEQYYGMTGTDDIAVIVNNQVIAKADNGEYGAGGRLIDEQAYIEYSVLHDFVNKRFTGMRMRIYCCIHCRREVLLQT